MMLLSFVVRVYHLDINLTNFINPPLCVLYVGANNVFLLTKYSGQDPENFNGIDTNFYPRPRTFNAGVSIDF